MRIGAPITASGIPTCHVAAATGALVLWVAASADSDRSAFSSSSKMVSLAVCSCTHKLSVGSSAGGCLGDSRVSVSLVSCGTAVLLGLSACSCSETRAAEN
eukprot:1172477-Prorocentrum_minimum.AAC.1